MRDLLLAVPSRGRPQNVTRLRDAMRGTCTADTTLLLGLDDDDPQLGAYLDLAGPSAPRTRVVVRPGLRQVVAWINELAVPRAGEYRAIGTIGDDNVPVTPGWDSRMLAALEDAPLAFGNDENPHRPAGSLCCHIFARSEIIAALGYLGPPCLKHMYVDDAWMSWGRASGISYLHDVIIRHEHWTTGAAWDQTYADSHALMDADRRAYQAYCRDWLERDIAVIQGAVRAGMT